MSSSLFQREETSSIPKRVLIVGASSYLGSVLAMGLRDEFEVFGTFFESPMRIEGVHFAQMNCLDGNEILASAQRFNPDYVIYCPGVYDHARCAVNPMLASALNTKAVMLFFKVFSRPVPLLYFSTDQVFSSEMPKDEAVRFHEKSPLAPKNECGISRMRGEHQILQHNRFTHVMRLPKIYGECLGSPYRPRETWVQEALRLLETQEQIKAVSNQRRSTLYVGDFVRAVRLFVRKSPVKSSLFHLSASDSLSSYEAHQTLARVFDKDTKFLEEINLKDSLQGRSYEEAEFTSMTSKLFEEKYEFRFQNFEEGLGEMKERLVTGFTQNWT